MSSSQLTQDELKSCRVFFNNFDRNRTGSINGWELQIALEAMNQNPTEDDLANIMQQLGADNNGTLDFQQFVRAIQLQRELEKRNDHEGDFLAAFVAMGGGADAGGSVQAERLRKVIKEDFGLTFKIDELLEDLQPQQEGQVNYKEFKVLFS